MTMTTTFYTRSPENAYTTVSSNPQSAIFFPSPVACLKGEQEVRRPWWAPSCLSAVFVRVAKRNRQSRVVSLKLEA